MLLELVKEAEEAEKVKREDYDKAMQEKARLALISFITPEMQDDLKLQLNNIATETRGSRSFASIVGTHEDFFAIKISAICDYSAFQTIQVASYAVNYSAEIDFNHFICEDVNFDKRDSNIGMGKFFLRTKARKVAIYNELMTSEKRPSVIRDSPYLSIYEKAALISKIENNEAEKAGRAAEQVRLSIERETVRKKNEERYNNEYFEYCEKCKEIWEAYVAENFKPWSYQIFKVVPNTVSFEIDCESEDLAEQIAEGLVFEFNIIGGIDESGLYTRLFSKGEMRKIEILGTIVSKETIEINSHTSGILGKVLYPNAGSSLFCAYFDPRQDVSLPAFPDKPVR